MDENQIPIETLVHDLIGHVAGKWTTLIAELWAEKDMLRLTRLSERSAGISQKCSGSLRHMERNGLVTRIVHRVLPPKLEYELSGFSISLGAAFWVCRGRIASEFQQSHSRAEMSMF